MACVAARVYGVGGADAKDGTDNKVLFILHFRISANHFKQLSKLWTSFFCRENNNFIGGFCPASSQIVSCSLFYTLSG